MKTIELDERLFAEVEEVAAQTGQTVTAVIEHAVRESFAGAGKHQNRAGSSSRRTLDEAYGPA